MCAGVPIGRDSLLRLAERSWPQTVDAVDTDHR
jgi:hypothetical protein